MSSDSENTEATDISQGQALENTESDDTTESATEESDDYKWFIARTVTGKKIRFTSNQRENYKFKVE